MQSNELPQVDMIKIDVMVFPSHVRKLSADSWPVADAALRALWDEIPSDDRNIFHVECNIKTTYDGNRKLLFVPDAFDGPELIKEALAMGGGWCPN